MVALFVASSRSSAAPKFELEGASAHGIVPATNTEGYTDTRAIYLDRATTTFVPATIDDSRLKASSLLTATTTIKGWIPTEEEWTATMNCMVETWAPFQIVVTDLNPGQFPHVTVALGGMPAQLGLPADIAGAAPFAADCGVVDNAVVFVFEPALDVMTPGQICHAISSQVAAAYGLDHESIDTDVTSELPCGAKEFVDVTETCGTDSERVCGPIGHECRPHQNSRQLLYARIGKYVADADPPVIFIREPADGATVNPDFVVDVFATDRDGVEVGTLQVDGQHVHEIAGPGPFTFEPGELSEGEHMLTVSVSDGEDLTVTTRKITVDDPTNDDTSVGCMAAGRSSGVLVGLAIAGVVTRRRRRLA